MLPLSAGLPRFLSNSINCRRVSDKFYRTQIIKDALFLEVVEWGRVKSLHGRKGFDRSSVMFFDHDKPTMGHQKCTPAQQKKAVKICILGEMGKYKREAQRCG